MSTSDTPDLSNPAELNFNNFKKIVIDDYRIAFESRQVSLLGRREVLTGKAKFGIFGDGKEVAQVAMAKAFNPGDWRSGYYRDQTFLFAAGMLTISQFFAQLYAHPSVKADPSSAGRQMNAHFASRSLHEDGSWKNLMKIKNCASDISATGGQMARLVGLGLASKVYRNNPSLAHLTQFSTNGDEVAFGTIGNAATSEGVFFETINAIGVLQVPVIVSIWDDHFGISVPAKYQTTKEDISEVLKGFQRDADREGYEIFKVKGWDYPSLCETYGKAIQLCREHHRPILIHVDEMTQPLGHSTSGSHERYKTKERLQWEMKYDCLLQMRQWMITSDIAKEEELIDLETTAKNYVQDCQKKAWEDFSSEIKIAIAQVIKLLMACEETSVQTLAQELQSVIHPGRKDMIAAVRQAIRLLRHSSSEAKKSILAWYQQEHAHNDDRYHSKLFTETIEQPASVAIVAAIFDENPKMVDGREVLNACFDANFSRDPRILAFGEDLGQIGDVNQGFAGLQEKFGTTRVADTGIREMTIIGKGIGLALRGLKPIAEIQYVDYFLYALNVLSDDLASLSYRTKAGQKAPLIIRTRGHRLEGIWHSGSPIGMLLHALRGIHICVPRNMTQAAGMYNTLFRSDEPALVIESLNGYRLKEKLPQNVGEFTVPLGSAEMVRIGTNITIVSYGSTLRIVLQAAEELAKLGIEAEVIDPQTIAPFDKTQLCLQSLAKTNKLLVVDEDVPGGASAYILQEILETQNGYYHLDAQPKTLTAKAHRPPYGSDGDYFSKPSIDDIIEVVYQFFHEANPTKFPPLF